MKKVLIGVGILFLVIYWFTHGLLDTFFQQDEWNGFGYVIQLSQRPWWSWFDLLGPSHFIPLSQYYWFVMYRLFGFDARFYAANAILLHAIASYLVYVLALRLSNNTLVSTLTSFLFATNSRSAQAFTHLAVFPATLTSSIVILLFFITLTYIAERKIFLKRDLWILLLLFFSAVFLREDGLLLPALLPIYLWLFAPQLFTRKNSWFFITFFGCVIGFFGFRVFLQTHATEAIAVTTGSFKKILFYNAISLPFKLVVQNIFEGIELFNLFWKYKMYVYTEYHHQITVGLMYTVVYDFVILVVFNALTGFGWFVTRTIHDKKFWRTILFCLAWILVAAELLSVVGRPLNVVESRYLYLSSFAVLYIFSYVLIRFMSLPKSSLLRVIFSLVGLGIIVAMTWTSYTQMQITIQRYVFQSQARKHVVDDLVRLFPTIPKNTAFYVSCKNICWRNGEYFGIPNELVLPYTSGPGWIFLLYYAQHNEQGYAPFFVPKDGHEFLWDFGEEGYRKIGNYGFGFFRQRHSLEQAVLHGDFYISNVIGLTYDERDFSLHDYSKMVQDNLTLFISTQSAVLE